MTIDERDANVHISRHSTLKACRCKPFLQKSLGAAGEEIVGGRQKQIRIVIMAQGHSRFRSTYRGQGKRISATFAVAPIPFHSYFQINLVRFTALRLTLWILSPPHVINTHYVQKCIQHSLSFESCASRCTPTSIDDSQKSLAGVP